MKSSLKVIVRKKDKLLFSDIAESVSSINDVGPFDVLPYHKNFVCIIKSNVEIKQSGGGIFSIPVNRGIFQARNNCVEIYLFQSDKISD